MVKEHKKYFTIDLTCSTFLSTGSIKENTSRTFLNLEVNLSDKAKEKGIM